jgi:MtaA/CmuA family methyltransferase
MMTPKERYMTVLQGGEPDVLPRIPILMQFAAEHIGSNYGAFASDHRVLVEANMRCAEDFEIDQLSAISDPYRETAGFGAEIKFHENAVPECVRPPLADNDDLDTLVPPDPEQAPRMRDRIDAIRLYRERDDNRHSILGWIEGPGALAADLRGLSEFYMDLLEEPDWCGELMDICTDTAIRFAKAQLDAGADSIGVGDAMCSQVSAEAYHSLILPRQMRLVEAIHEQGGIARLHICGQTRHLWAGINKLAIDILDVDHMVDLAEARRALGPKVALAGNIDPVAGVRFGKPEEIRAHVRRNYTESGPPYMVCAGCEIPAGSPMQNLAALCEPVHP